MRIALVNPNKGSFGRGVGFYCERLLRSVNDLGVHELVKVPLSFNPRDYHDFDAVHFPYFDPFFLSFPPVFGRPVIVTIHDLIPVALKDNFPRGIRGEVKWQLQKRLIKFAKLIVTDSNFSKNDIIKYLNYPSDRVDVVYLAPGEEFQIVKSDTAKLREKFSLSDKYFLYVGDINYNKNIPGLLKAFAIFRQKHKDVQLVLVGKSFNNFDVVEAREIDSLIKELTLENFVKRLGFVDTKDLVELYNFAVAYVHPATYEGFGFPLLEALSCGCPVICGKNSSLPELVGDCGIYTNVVDPSDFSNSMEQTYLLTKSQRQSNQNKYQAQASKFTWLKTAKKMNEIYEKILAGN